MASGSITATNITAASNVTTVVARKPQNDGNANDDDRAEDAAVAVSVIDSSSSIHIGGSAVLTSAGAMNIASNNTLNTSTTADGLNGTSDAGGTFATTTVTGATDLLIDGSSTVTAAGNLSLTSTSNRTANTVSTTTVKGATEDGNAGTKTKGQTALSDNNASNSEGNMGLAAAVSIGIVSGDTRARVLGGNVKSTAGTFNLASSATHSVTTTADGTNSSGSSDVGVGGSMALNRVDNIVTAQIADTVVVTGTARNLTIEATATHQATTEAENGASGDVGIGVSVALAIIDNDTTVRLGTGGPMTLSGTAGTSKANISIGTNATVLADQIDIKGNNYLVKNKRDTTKPLRDQFRTNVRSRTASGLSLDVLSSSSDIGTANDPFQSVVTFGTGSNVTTVGSTAVPSSFEVATFTNFDAEDKVDVEGISAIAAAKVTTTTNATNRIDVANSTLKAHNIGLMVGKFANGSSGGVNILDNYSYATVSTASFLPSAALDFIYATLNENNIVNVSGSTKLLAVQDVDLVAKQGISTSKTDGSVVSLSVIPYGHGIDDVGALNRNNQVNVAPSAFVQAGSASRALAF